MLCDKQNICLLYYANDTANANNHGQARMCTLTWIVCVDGHIVDAVVYLVEIITVQDLLPF